MATSEGSFCEATASSKPWHLTYSSEFKEVFIWKNGMRMKLKDGTSGGPVTSVSVLDAADRTITVSKSANQLAISFLLAISCVSGNKDHQLVAPCVCELTALDNSTL